MVATQKHALAWKASALRCSVNKLGELRWCLPAITPHLIHLTRGGFDVENGLILDDLLNRGRDDARVRRANRVDANSFTAPIAMDDVLQLLACAFGLSCHGLGFYSG
jgi:hypothetical protein